MIYSYRAYGLNISSDIPVAALREKSTPSRRPDLIVNSGPQPDWVRYVTRLPRRVDSSAAGEPDRADSTFTLTSYGDTECFQLAYGDGARFIVDSTAHRLWAECRSPLTDEDLATYFLGPVMGFVLRRLGLTALHASSVSVFGKAVVLCGPSGSGKSTTAAALALRAVPVLAEDISSIVESRGLLNVEPGYPRVCLWPEAVETLFGARDALPSLTPTWEKCYLALNVAGAEFEAKKQTVGAIYVFAPRADEANAPRIEDLSMRDALLELVQNTYMNWALDRNQRAAELDMLTRLVTSVPVCKIVPHDDPGRIGALCDLIIGHSERLLGSPIVTAGCNP